MLTAAGLLCRGEKGISYRLVRPLGFQVPGKEASVWLAVDDSTAVEYVVKRPPTDDDDSDKSWCLSAFKHELEMQRLFQGDPMIRKLVDYVPESEPFGPMMVLEAFASTLWDARHARPFTIKEIKWIMKGVLLGIYTVHMKNLVYTDLKMENIILSGLDYSRPNDDVRNIIVRLADCGAISKPSSREITSLTYRSPEVYFGKPWNESTDVWSWGIILAQLLQAKIDLKKPGLYDSGDIGALLEEKAKAVRDVIAIDFELAIVPFYADDEKCAKLLPPPRPDDAYMWANNMFESGVAEEDIQFLAQVLNPFPDARLTVPEILDSGYLG